MKFKQTMDREGPTLTIQISHQEMAEACSGMGDVKAQAVTTLLSGKRASRQLTAIAMIVEELELLQAMDKIGREDPASCLIAQLVVKMKLEQATRASDLDFMSLFDPIVKKGRKEEDRP